MKGFIMVNACINYLEQSETIIKFINLAAVRIIYGFSKPMNLSTIELLNDDKILVRHSLIELEYLIRDATK